MRHPAPFSIKTHPSFLKILFFIVLTCGVLLITYTAYHFKNESYKELRAQGLQTSETFNNNDFSKLSFTISDTANSEFIRFSTQLQSIFQAYKSHDEFLWSYTSIYFMIKRNDSLVLGPLSSTIHEFQQKKPGMTHKIVNDLTDVFTKKHIVITKPYHNDYGSFLSIIIPFSNPHTNEVQCLLIMDITKVQWYKKLFLSCMLPFLITLLLLLFVLFFRFYPGLYRKEIYMAYPVVQYILITGILLTASISFIAYLHEFMLRNESFYQLARSQVSLITDEISDLHEIRFENFTGFFENSQDVDSSEFYDFTKHLLSDPNIYAWGWIPLIPDSLRITFEKMLDKSKSPTEGIWQKDFKGNKSRAEHRPNYYPIAFIAQNDPNNTLKGFDTGSDSLLNSTIQRALATGTTEISAPFYYPIENHDNYRAYAFRAVFDKITKRIRGFTFFVLDYSTLFENSSTIQESGLQINSLSVLELLSDTLPFFLTTNYGQKFLNKKEHSNLPERSLMYMTFITAFDRTYALVVHPNKVFLSYYPIHNSWIIFFAGSILTIILSILFGSLKSHGNQLERRVEERTAKLKESEARFSQIAEQCGEIIWEVDNNGLYTYISRACSVLTGYSENDVINKMHIYDIRPGESKLPFRTLFFESLQRKIPICNVQTKLTTKSNKVLFVLTNGVPVTDDDGTIKGYRGSDLDITEIKRAEQEKEKLQMDLIQAQKMESIGRLAGGIAHDFNNMLCAISGSAEIALESTTQEEVAHTLQEILDAAQRSSDLTFQLLAFARKQTINPTVIDLNDNISSLYKMLKRLIGENIDLTWIPGNTLGKIKIDRSQVDQLMANLVVNARDAIGDTGKITIETENYTFTEEYCSTHFESKPGNYVMIAVSDNGCGMDKETLAHLFEPFFTTKSLGQGTGLGLATVYGIVKQNNGFVHVYSEPSQGTSVHIYFPRIETPDPTQPLQKNINALPSGTETILVVEDEESILEFCRIMLNRCGYTVLTAKTPKEALIIAREQKKLDLLLTDVIMPEMNGKELCRKVSEIFPELRCIYMSGYTANVIAHQGILEEGINFIHKPFSKAVLAEKIRAVLDSSTTGQ